ncbi:MAG: helix-hairpin-helix domain-containing protein [bacterium]|nr:helix-hairpin-helix domain-containing protein [bacterium]
MEKFYEIFDKYRNYILSFILLVLMIVSEFFLFYYFSNNFSSINDKLKEKDKTLISKKIVKSEKLVIDIKGQVKKPGVYFMEDGDRVIDVVKKAGGFTVYADTSANNLGMKVKDEMVIVIYSEKEINDYLAVKEKEKNVYEKCSSDISLNGSCVSDFSINSSLDDEKDSKDVSSKEISDNGTSDKTSDNSKKLVSINTASKEELMTVSGIGESKALSIIEYRKTKRFEKIEDIKNVSGIGDKLFEKIKEYITI